ncbi:Uncharacterized protein dnm_025710 [Desulfonema magnum]|uniref:Uncharacterized protein n=1 Tax=Desulfonema magnum TaxID=45655 RepID=A0A975GM83_9BACT|nr:Uncharacterized protein dnm_025710 [Desulfonema magnum]
MIKFFFCHSCESRNPRPPEPWHRPKMDSCFRRNDRLSDQIGSKNFDHQVK